MPQDTTPATPGFDHVRSWVFDLDNTLYPPEARLFDQIERLMTDYVSATLGVSRSRADHLRASYWQQYGTTLAGLMAEHDLDPGPYLAAVHDIDLGHLEVDGALNEAIRALPGRRIVYTNGSRRHAERVLEARGLSAAFDGIYSIEDAGFRPKPERAAYEAIFGLDRLDPALGAMFEDDPRNLSVPHEMGMRTVLVGRQDEGDHIHHRTGNLAGFLSQLG